jgi:hypothetical protein
MMMMMMMMMTIYYPRYIRWNGAMREEAVVVQFSLLSWSLCEGSEVNSYQSQGSRCCSWDWTGTARRRNSRTTALAFSTSATLLTYRIFSNLIRTSFCRFLKPKKKLVRGSNPHLSFNRPLPTRQTDAAMSDDGECHE